MDILHSRFFSVNVVLLSVVGLWPYQKLTSWKLHLLQITYLFLVVTTMIVQMIKLIEIWGNLDLMIECLTPTTVQFGACFKALNYIVHRKNMIKLLEAIQNDWLNMRDEEEIKILTKYAERGRSLTITYTVYLYGATFLYLMIPLAPRILDITVPLNESRPPSYLYQTQYYVDPEEYFIWIVLHTYTGTIITMTAIMATDTMFMCYVMHVCGIIRVIGHRLEKLTSKRFRKNDNSYVMSKDDDDKCYREILLFIEKHETTIELANIIESSYTISYLILFGLAVVLLSLSAVQLLIKLGQIEEMLRLFSFNVGQCNHLFFCSWPCQKLIDESLRLQESLYAVEWYSLSEKNKNIIKFIMLRVQKPQQLTAGKLYIMSMENFATVIQTSISYFTVFASVR